MNIHTLFPSRYVKASDLAGKHVTVEIEKVVIEEVGIPPKVEPKPVLYFKRAKKAMIGNRTNCMTIAQLYGPETTQWHGRLVTLYPTRVNAFGSVFEVIRILAEIPPKPKATEQPEEIQFMAEDIPDDDLNDPTATVVEPEPAQNKQRKLGSATEHHLREYNALLGALYGRDADQWKHHYTSQAGKTTSKDLTQAEAAQIIAGLQAQLVNKIVLAVDDDDLNKILLTHNQPSLTDASPVALTHIWRDVTAQTQPQAEAA